MSPLENKHNISTKELEEDLTRLKGIVSADEIRLLGGEPLLNDELASLATVVKRSGIGNKVTISTNGILLNKWRDSEILWNLIDECEVSIYDTQRCNPELIVSDCIYISKIYGVTFYIYYCSMFRQAGAFEKCDDFEMTRMLFESCILSKMWQCFNIFEGRFYLCPQAIGFSRFNPNVDVKTNSVSLNSSSLKDDINNFIERKEPLPACSYCYGCVGKICRHEQISRKEYLSDFQMGFGLDRIDTSFLDKIRKRGGDGFLSLETIEKTKIIEKGRIRERN